MKTYLTESEICLSLPQLQAMPSGWLDPANYKIYHEQNAFYLEVVDSGLKPITLHFEGELCYWEAQIQKYGKKDVPLLKALGLVGANPPQHIYDLTAGMLKDTLQCLAVGVTVTAVERNPVIYALVQLNLNECSNLRGLKYYFGHCMNFAHLFVSQVLYFDPMFEVAGKSAASKKNMEIFKDLVGADSDANEILQQLLLTQARRVVVKRADKAPLLADQPHHQIKSKTVRFDIYIS